MDTQNRPAVAAPLERPVRPAVAVAHGSDEHLTLLGAPWHWNLLQGVDRADMLGFGRACMEAERARCVRIIEAHQVPVGNSAAGEMAAEWTMDALSEIRNAIRRA